MVLQRRQVSLFGDETIHHRDWEYEQGGEQTCVLVLHDLESARAFDRDMVSFHYPESYFETRSDV